MKKSMPANLERLGWLLFILGIVICVFGYYVDARQAAFNTIVGFLFLTSIAMGAIFLIALDSVAGSVWSVPMRRINEFLAALIPFAALLALPVFFYLPEVFSWAESGSAVVDPLIQSKRQYLNVNFFVIRFIVIFAIWTIFYYFLTKNSLKQDVTKDQKYTRWNIRLSAVFMPIFAFGLTVIAIDWGMSLEPHWYSTIYGVYYFSGAVIATLATSTYIIVQLHERGYLQYLRRDHFYSLGTLMFVFVNFWAYIAFSQFLLIWYANMPEETFWFIMRWKNGWQGVSILLLVVQFWVPYFILLSQESKMNLRRLKFISIWLLFAHLLDLYWLIMPTYNADVTVNWMMIGFPLLFVGLVITVFAWKMKRHNLMPIGDPRLQRGLEFHL
jgi:hypothetical protein